MYTCMCVCVCMYIYIYIFIGRNTRRTWTTERATTDALRVAAKPTYICT